MIPFRMWWKILDHWINKNSKRSKKHLIIIWVRVWVMVFNATFNNILVISWLSVLLVEQTWVPRENHQPAASDWKTLSHNFYQVHLTWAGFELTTLVVIGTDCISSCKSNYCQTCLSDPLYITTIRGLLSNRKLDNK